MAKDTSSRRGRPKSLDKKHTRTVTVTDDAWQGLRNQADRKGISISELNEKLGRNEFAVVTCIEQRLQEVGIYPRICAYTERPSPGFVSLIAFVKNAISNLSAEKLSIEVLEEQVVSVLRDVLECTVLASYLYPDIITFRSLTSCTPWLAYALLLEYGFACTSSSAVPKIQDSRSVYECIDQISETLKQLQKSGAPLYSILKMRFLEGFSLAQMKNILQQQELQPEQPHVSSLVKDRIELAFGKFREICSHLELPDSSFRKESLDAEAFNQSDETAVPADVHEYCRLISLAHWTTDDRESLRKIMETVNRRPKMAFWVCELNYLLRTEDYSNQFEKLQKAVIDGLDERLSSMLDSVDKELIFCTSMPQMKDLFYRFMQEKIRVNKSQSFSQTPFDDAICRSLSIIEVFDVSKDSSSLLED